MFSNVPSPQNEQTPLAPRSPYAASKAHAFWMTHMYREGHGLFATNGILFNHESPRRGETFVTRKITRGIAQIVAATRKSCTWATSMLVGTGATRPSTWKRCR